MRRTVPLLGLVLSVLVTGALGTWWRTQPGGADQLAASPTQPSAATSTAPSATSTSTTTVSTTTTLPPLLAHPVPAGSGEGRRVVYSISAQRVWWVGEDGVAVRTAPVSGRPATPDVGTYQVFSRSEQATGLDGSSMRYFVRFTRGEDGWAIGFHDIPTMGGVPVQRVDQLGTPLSHGCIRQAPEDALFTWFFLQLGDTVVVVA